MLKDLNSLTIPPPPPYNQEKCIYNCRIVNQCGRENCLPLCPPNEPLPPVQPPIDVNKDKNKDKDKDKDKKNPPLNTLNKDLTITREQCIQGCLSSGLNSEKKSCVDKCDGLFADEQVRVSS